MPFKRVGWFQYFGRLESRVVEYVVLGYFKREGVGTSNFRTSTGQKFQNVEMVFLVYQNVESQKDQNVESDLPMAFCLLNLT